ncbi:MAG: hypothetical protein ABI700_08860 [Chloroflexota bacterium]
MKFTIDWDDPEHSILYASYEGEWVLEEYTASFDQGVQMMRSVDHRVDVIVHTLDAAAQSPPLWALRTWRYAVINSPPNAGLTVSVPGNAGVRAFSFALSRLAGPHYYGKLATADTLDEARQLIHNSRLA